jgi:hypothetical protein
MSLRKLITLHIKELPFFVQKWFQRREFIAAAVKANPEIPLGGLPVAAKDTRCGSGSHFLPTQRLQESDNLQSFIENYAPVVVKPLYGSQSRNISIEDEELSPSKFTEPMLVQPYHPGKEFAICVANYGEKINAYSVVEIFADGDIWDGEGSYVNRTSACQTNGLKSACQSVCNEVGLQFGRLDVKANSLAALQRGDFYVMEVNGSTAVDMRLYTDAPQRQKREWLTNHWQRMLTAADSHQKEPVVPWGLLGGCLLFSLAPRSTIHFWGQLEDGDFTSRTQTNRRAPRSGTAVNIYKAVVDSITTS